MWIHHQILCFQHPTPYGGCTISHRSLLLRLVSTFYQHSQWHRGNGARQYYQTTRHQNVIRKLPKTSDGCNLTNIQTFKGPSAWLPPVFPGVLYLKCKCLPNASSSRMEWDVLPSAGYCEFWHKRKRFLSLRNMFYWGKGELLHMGVGQCIAMMLRREKQRPITYSPLNSCHSFCF